MNAKRKFPRSHSAQRFLTGIGCLIFSAALGWAQPTVSNVRATPRAGTKFVDITYDLAHATGLASTIRVEVSQNGGATYASVASLSGALGAGIVPGTGKTVAWNAGQDWTTALFSTVRVRVTADDGQGSGAPAPTVFILIPAGTFTMGDNLDGMTAAATHAVTLPAFHLAKTETTKAEWDDVRAWAATHGYTDLTTGDGKAPTHPVQMVTWYDVVKWCNAKSEKDGLVPVYYTNDTQTTVYRAGSVDGTIAQVKWTASGYRLPTEAEWEYAARGRVAGKRFPWGDTITHQQANYDSSTSYAYDVSTTRGYHPTYAVGSMPYTSPVGSFLANGYGLVDMAGNVWEWCWDWYGSVDGAAVTAPRGAVLGTGRVVRGGGWVYDAGAVRSAYRYSGTPGLRGNGFGFRPARNSVP